MSKSYPDQLGEWVKHRESTKRDKNLVSFLAVIDDVKLAVEAGYSVKTIWANMTETKRILCGYDTFLNYVNRLIRRKKVSEEKPVVPAGDTTAGSAPGKTGSATPPQKTTPVEPAGFTFDSTPKKEDLL